MKYREPVAFEDTELAAKWYDRVMRDPPNDLFVVISASSRTPVSGTGKTTLATTIAKAFDQSSGGFDAAEKATVEAQEFVDLLREVEKQSAVIFDEAQGTPQGSALNTRRGMKTETIEAINGILAGRDQQLTVIMIVQQLSMLDSSLYPLIDCWLLIRKHPSHPTGPIATHHELTRNDYDLSSAEIKTPAIEDLTWDSLPASDSDYTKMEALKQAAKQKSTDGEDENRDLPKDIQMEIAQQFRDMGKSLEWIANEVDKVTYSRETIRKQTVAEGEKQTA